MKNKYSPFVKVARKVCPAVITILVTKDLPKIEGYFTLPFENQKIFFPKIKGNKTQKTKIGGGSGFIVSSSGYIITCYHVVSDSSAEYVVILDPNHKYKAEVLARDPLVDLAVLKIKGKKFPYLKMADSTKIKLGESVIAVGNALGEFEDTISAGIVSGLSRKIRAYDNTVLKTMSLRGLIQTDAAINPGNSGGPLVNMESKVIGVNTAMVSGAENIGFAIPINYAKNLLNEVLKYGRIKRPFLGIRYIILNREISQSNNLPVDYGALIVREILGESPIIKNSPAEKAGLKEYDIILKIDNKKVTQQTTLNDILSEYKIGDEIKIEVLRNKKIIKLKAKLEERK